jgi:TolB-like protein/DNA-binding winged helix-turn-helix (wHTH) protein
VPDSSTSLGILRFDAFEVDLRTGETRKHGIRIKLRGHPQQILVMLLDRPGEVVTREEIRRQLWPADTFVDFEHSVNTAIKILRQALGDSAELPQFIETLPKLGYRFIAKVRALPSLESATTPAAASTEAGVTPPAPSAPGARTRFARRWPALASAFAVFVAVAVIGISWFHSHAASQPPAGRAMFAVLPFENLTGDASQDYFSDGLTEEMISQLGRTDPQTLGVIARTSVMHYKHSPEPLQQIGSELGVQYLLEGSVRRDANRVRITAKLIQVKDQTPLWAREYDRDVSSLLALQSEIAQEIADEIQVTLGRKARAPSIPAAQNVLTPAVYESHDLYLKGLYSWNKRTVDGFRQAADYFQQAVAKDATNARAYAGLADSYALITSYGFVPPGESMEKARAAALRALELDEKLPEAHTSLAFVVESYDWDWQAAEREYQRAIQLDPSYATAHQWYAECLTFQGRFDEALAESARARQLDPLSLIISADHAAILYFSRQFPSAIEEFQSILSMEPGYARANLVIYAYTESGRFSDAMAHVNGQKQLGGMWTQAAQAYVYGRSGDQTRAREILRNLERLDAGNHQFPIFSSTIAPAYAGAGEKQKALDWLDRLCEQHYTVSTTLKVDPALDSLRDEPRFQELLRKVHLAR